MNWRSNIWCLCERNISMDCLSRWPSLDRLMLWRHGELDQLMGNFSTQSVNWIQFNSIVNNCYFYYSTTSLIYLYSAPCGSGFPSGNAQLKDILLDAIMVHSYLKWTECGWKGVPLTDNVYIMDISIMPVGPLTLQTVRRWTKKFIVVGHWSLKERIDESRKSTHTTRWAEMIECEYSWEWYSSMDCRKNTI